MYLVLYIFVIIYFSVFTQLEGQFSTKKNEKSNSILFPTKYGSRNVWKENKHHSVVDNYTKRLIQKILSENERKNKHLMHAHNREIQLSNSGTIYPEIRRMIRKYSKNNIDPVKNKGQIVETLVPALMNVNGAKKIGDNSTQHQPTHSMRNSKEQFQRNSHHKVIKDNDDYEDNETGEDYDISSPSEKKDKVSHKTKHTDSSSEEIQIKKQKHTNEDDNSSSHKKAKSNDNKRTHNTKHKHSSNEENQTKIKKHTQSSSQSSEENVNKKNKHSHHSKHKSTDSSNKEIQNNDEHSHKKNHSKTKNKSSESSSDESEEDEIEFIPKKKKVHESPVYDGNTNKSTSAKSMSFSNNSVSTISEVTNSNDPIYDALSKFIKENNLIIIAKAKDNNTNSQNLSELDIKIKPHSNINTEINNKNFDSANSQTKNDFNTNENIYKDPHLINQQTDRNYNQNLYTTESHIYNKDKSSWAYQNQSDYNSSNRENRNEFDKSQNWNKFFNHSDSTQYPNYNQNNYPQQSNNERNFGSNTREYIGVNQYPNDQNKYPTELSHSKIDIVLNTKPPISHWNDNNAHWNRNNSQTSEFQNKTFKKPTISEPIIKSPINVNQNRELFEKKISRSDNYPDNFDSNTQINKTKNNQIVINIISKMFDSNFTKTVPVPEPGSVIHPHINVNVMPGQYYSKNKTNSTTDSKISARSVTDKNIIDLDYDVTSQSPILTQKPPEIKIKPRRTKIKSKLKNAMEKMLNTFDDLDMNGVSSKSDNYTLEPLSSEVEINSKNDKKVESKINDNVSNSDNNLNNSNIEMESVLKFLNEHFVHFLQDARKEMAKNLLNLTKIYSDKNNISKLVLDNKTEINNLNKLNTPHKNVNNSSNTNIPNQNNQHSYFHKKLSELLNGYNNNYNSNLNKKPKQMNLANLEKFQRPVVNQIEDVYNYNQNSFNKTEMNNGQENNNTPSKIGDNFTINSMNDLNLNDTDKLFDLFQDLVADVFEKKGSNTNSTNNTSVVPKNSNLKYNFPTPQNSYSSAELLNNKNGNSGLFNKVQFLPNNQESIQYLNQKQPVSNLQTMNNQNPRFENVQFLPNQYLDQNKPISNIESINSNQFNRNYNNFNVQNMQNRQISNEEQFKKVQFVPNQNGQILKNANNYQQSLTYKNISPNSNNFNQYKITQPMKNTTNINQQNTKPIPNKYLYNTYNIPQNISQGNMQLYPNSNHSINRNLQPSNINMQNYMTPNFTNMNFYNNVQRPAQNISQRNMQLYHNSNQRSPLLNNPVNMNSQNLRTDQTNKYIFNNNFPSSRPINNVQNIKPFIYNNPPSVVKTYSTYNKYPSNQNIQSTDGKTINLMVPSINAAVINDVIKNYSGGAINEMKYKNSNIPVQNSYTPPFVSQMQNLNSNSNKKLHLPEFLNTQSLPGHNMYSNLPKYNSTLVNNLRYYGGADRNPIKQNSTRNNYYSNFNNNFNPNQFYNLNRQNYLNIPRTNTTKPNSGMEQNLSHIKNYLKLHENMEITPEILKQLNDNPYIELVPCDKNKTQELSKQYKYP